MTKDNCEGMVQYVRSKSSCYHIFFQLVHWKLSLFWHLLLLM